MEQLFPNIHFVERRAKPRINCDYPAVIRGQDANGKKYEENARVINLSRGGAFVTLLYPVRNDEEVSVRIVFPTEMLEWGTPSLATRAVVVRSEQLQDGLVGIAIKFVNFRFM